MARVLLDALAPYHLMFVEEPVLTEHVDGIADVLRNSATPIALGERLYSRWDFKDVITSGVVDIIQPDLSHAGGITEVRKIAAMAEAYDIAAACLQLDAVAYNAVIQEQSLGIHYNTSNDLLDYLVDPSVFAYEAGSVTIPQGPGLGIEVDEDYVRERAVEGHRWRNPVWRHADGSFAEW
jgi:galactonate dehydratase